MNKLNFLNNFLFKCSEDISYRYLIFDHFDRDVYQNRYSSKLIYTVLTKSYNNSKIKGKIASRIQFIISMSDSDIMNMRFLEIINFYINTKNKYIPIKNSKYYDELLLKLARMDIGNCELTNPYIKVVEKFEELVINLLNEYYPEEYEKLKLIGM